MRSGGHLNVGSGDGQNPPGMSGAGRAQAEDIRMASGQRERASARGLEQVRRGYKSPPVFPQSQGGCNGMCKLSRAPAVT